MSSDQELMKADRDARKDALNVERSFIVQAPAGSGKTELLIQRYLCLLAKVDDPEEVLAITFTRKAAAEMRLRVVQALQRATRGEVPDETHEKITSEAATAVLARDAKSSWGLVDNPRRMRIQTLDSLNASIARMQPLTSGATTGAAVVDMTLMSALYREAAAATLDWLGDQGRAGDAAREVLLHIDNNTGLYIGYLSKMLNTRDQWLPFIGAGLLSDDETNALRRRFESSLEAVVEGHLQEICAVMPESSTSEIINLAAYAVENLLRDGKQDALICDLADLGALPDASASALNVWQGLTEFLLKRDGDLRKQVNKTIGFPADNKLMKQRMSDLLESLAEETSLIQALHMTRKLPPVEYTDEQWSVLLSLFRLLPIAVAELKRLSSARGVTDYVEIALSAGTALGTADEPGDLALLLDYQVRHILVDEMQDTSKAQYRMLEALTGGWQSDDGRTLFCVGDPMQSVYRFRNAEVAQFLLARDNGIGSVNMDSLILRRNFRSGEHLVHWFNTVFPLVLSDADNPASGAVSYSESIPVEKFSGQGEFHLYPLLGSDKDAEAEQSFAVVQKTLADHPGDSMAVLVRGRSHLPALLSKLRDANIAYQAVDLDRLADLPEIIDILALTRAFAHLGDRVAWLGLLRSPWVGLAWADLHRLLFNARRQTVWEMLADEQRVDTLSSHGQQAVRKIVEQLATYLNPDRSMPLHRRVESAWFDLGGPGILSDRNAVANVYRYLEVLASLEVGGTLADVVELQKQLDSEHVSTNVSARLQIMTMHKAKGLQFDHVLLHGLGRYPKPREKSVMSWFDLPNAHGGEDKIISPVGRADDVARNPIHQYIELTETTKDAHEKARLLYVACTRARKSLHLVGHAEISKDGDRLRSPQINTLLAAIWPAVEHRYARLLEKYEKPQDQNADTLWTEPVLRRFDANWTVPDLPPVPGQSQIVDDAGSGYEVDYYWVGAEARLAGTVVHRWLQRATDGTTKLESDTLDSLRTTSKRWLRELGAGEDSLEPICQRVLAALNAVLRDDKGRWLLQGEGAAELALSGKSGGRIQSIVIDRVRIDEDGSHWIVDYKTSTHEGGKLKDFLQAECDRYRGQLQRYARIYGAYSGAEIRCALYFPLLREFVEVDVER